MKHETGSLQTADGLTLHTESWLPEGDPKAVVLISHGLGEHIGRYSHVAAAMVEHGYTVYGLDHRGHGKSAGERAYFEAFDPVVADLKQYSDQVKAAHPGKKLFLYGHSLGSVIGLAFVLRHQRDLAGFVCSGTPLELEASQPALLVSVGTLLNHVVPKRALAGLPASTLSHDPAVVTGYDTDPLVFHGGVRIRMATHIIQVSREVKRRLGEITLPLFILHGGEDKLCPPEGSEKLYQGAASADKTLKLYPGLFHESHNEIGKEVVIADIIGWIDAHITA